MSGGGFLPDGVIPDGFIPDGYVPDVATGGTTPTTARRFPIKPQRRRFHIRLVSTGDDVSAEFLFDPIVKDPGSTRVIELDLYEICAAKWPSNETVVANEFCRPRIPNGFSYEATTGGLTSGREPRWPTTVSQTVRDGEVIWTCRASSGGGINALSAPSGTSDPTGLTISAVSVVENSKITVTYAGGLDGQDYAAVFAWTLEGVPWVGRQLIKVRKQ